VIGQRDAVLAVVAEAALEAGAVERVAEIIAKIETSRPLMLAAAAVVGVREASGDRDGAVALMDWLMEGIPEAGEDLDESSVLALAKAVADAGGVEQSEHAARVIEDFALRARALAAVARAAARSGQVSRATALVDEAEAVARSIGGPHDRVRTVASLLETINQAEDHEQVVVVVGGDGVLARPVGGTSVRARTLAVVTEVIAWTGDHGRAAALATEIEDALEAAGSHNNEDLLAGLARAAAETGQPERAEEIADRITRPEIQARTLAHLANATDPEAAQRLTARAFAIDLWTAVDVLHRQEPDVLLLLADDLGVAGLRTAPPNPVDPPPLRPASACRRRMRLRRPRRTGREP
jgi:hypothetical protein